MYLFALRVCLSVCTLRKQINLFSSHFFLVEFFPFVIRLCIRSFRTNFIDARCNFTYGTASFYWQLAGSVHVHCKLRAVNVMLRSVAILSFPRSLPPIKRLCSVHILRHTYSCVMFVCYTEYEIIYNGSCQVNT